MRKLAIPFAAILLLSSCMAQSPGEYYSEKPHVERIATANEFEQNSISTYYTLRSAVLNIINSHRESDTIRVNRYQGDLEADLKLITQEVTTEHPMGVYAVSSILFEQTSVLSYRELDVVVQYRRSAEEIESVVRVLNNDDLDRHLRHMFDSFSEKLVVSLSGFRTSDEAFYRTIERAWLQNALTALDLKSISFTFYPDNQTSRIVEIDVQYLEEREAIDLRVAQLEQAAAAVADEIMRQTGADKAERLGAVFAYLRENVAYDRDATRVVSETDGRQPKSSVYTAYGALVEQSAGQQGLVLAAKLLCDQLGIANAIISGALGEELYTWLMVNLDEQAVHFDVTSDVEEPIGEGDETRPVYLFDEDAARARFSWDDSVAYRVE